MNQAVIDILEKEIYALEQQRKHKLGHLDSLNKSVIGLERECAHLSEIINLICDCIKEEKKDEL